MSRIRTSITVVALAGASCAFVAPTADASAKGDAKKAFNSAFKAAKSGNYEKFCKSFTKSALKGFGGLKSCTNGVGKAAGSVANSSLKVKKVSARGSNATVSWSAGSKSYNTTMKKEGGKWKLVKVLG